MIALEGLSKVVAPRRSAGPEDNVAFEVAAGELVVQIGPSGSGETTTMRMIDRSETPNSGRMRVGGRDARTMDVLELGRGIGDVVRQGGPLPHVTVAENAAMAPRLLGRARERRREQAWELPALVGLPPERFGGRCQRGRSGGQQRRVEGRSGAGDRPADRPMGEPVGALGAVDRAARGRARRAVVGGRRGSGRGGGECATCLSSRIASWN